jgi:hypothetical protein
MNHASAKEVSWDRRRWCAALSLALVAQVVLVFVLSLGAPQMEPRLEPRVTVTRLTPPQADLRRLAFDLPAPDPTLFALVSRHGFTGESWRRDRAPVHRLLDWEEPPRWMRPNPAALGSTFVDAVETNDVARGFAPDKPAARVQSVRHADNLMPRESVLVIEGRLAGRAVLYRPEPPAWPHTELLSSSEVEVAVNAGGFVYASRLINSCGLPAADDKAIELAAKLRFQPLPAPRAAPAALPPLTWGRVIVNWLTVPAPTNPPPPVAPGRPNS